MAKKSLSLDSLITEPKAPEPVAEPAAPKKAAYRIGKRAFTAWANKEAYRQLKHLATDRDTTIQALLEEGMDLVFEKYGYEQIARSKEGNMATQP
ncbi:ribbon-helix-helix domain-containing protein [Methylobacterium nigriterrae]|uniref:ribbon-helix-helix domain-containing protein n=1 Tax=Methylobacterium nigriterrae TaxID=3127512 RepID=UPI0030132AF8